MADQRISQLTKLAQGDVAANDVLAIVDVGASTTKKVEAKDLFQAGANLADSASIDLIKLNQSSTTKLGTTALADDAVTAAKLADDSSIAYDSVAPSTNNFEGRGYVNSTSKNLQVWDGSAFQQVVAPTTGIGDLQVTTGKLANNAVTTAKVDAAGLAAAALATDSVTTIKIQDLAVTTGKLAALSVTTAKIAADAVTADELASNAVVTASIVDANVTEAKLAAGAVTEAKIGAAAVTVAKVADASLTYAKLNLADASVPGAKLVSNSVTSTQLAVDAVTTGAITALNVTTAKLADGAVTAAKLGALAVTTAKIAADAVTAAELANDAVDTAAIVNAAVTEAKLAAGAVTEAKIATSAVTVGKIADTQITYAKLNLADGSVPGAKLVSNSVTSTQLAVNAVTTGALTDLNVTTGKLADSAVTNAKLATGAITTAKIDAAGLGEAAIATSAVTTSKVLDGAITAAKLAADSTTIVQAGTPVGSGAYEGQLWFDTNTSVKYVWNGSAWIRQAALNSINFSDTTPLNFAVVYPDNHTANITTTLDTQDANAVFAGPTSGADAAPTFRALTPADLPNATASTKGIVQPGTGLAVNAGVLNHSNSVAPGTYTRLVVDAQGHISQGQLLEASDIPNLDAAKITTGELSTARIADAAITIDKLANYSTASIGTEFPEATFTGQLHLNSLDRSFYMWDGNVYVPIGISAGQIVLAGTFDASSPSGVGKVQSLTPEGVAAGFVVNSALPVPTLNNSKHYFVVSEGGTITSGNAPAGALAPPDLLLSVYSTTLPQWVEIDVSAGAGAIAAANVSFVPAGDIAASNVQTAIEEVSTECRNATNITSGTLAVARGGTNVASYTKGDLLAASAATTLTKLPVGTNGQVLRANSATATGLEYGADFVGTVTTVTSSTTALTVANPTTTPALTVRAATTSVDGIVQLSDSTNTTSSVLAATPTAVKSAYDLAALALPKAGGTVTGELLIGSAGTLVFEGSTDDGNEITLAVADPTADRTITLPNQTGTVLVSGNASIINADVNASAAIAGTKISPDFGSQTVATTGIFSHALGSVSAPTITFTGDANTGIYSPGADTLAFVEGGVEAMRIDSSGNVGIGTTSPNTRLEVIGEIRGVDGSFALLASNGSGTGQTSIGLRREGAPTDQKTWEFFSGASGEFKLRTINDTYTAGQDVFGVDRGTGVGVASVQLHTNGSERLRIDSSGRLGIGTSAPVTSLEVSLPSASATIGNIRITPSTAGQARYYLYNGGSVAEWLFGQKTSTDHKFKISTSVAGSETDVFTIDTNGNVGIGTTSPEFKLVANGTIKGVASTYALLASNGSGSGQTSIGLVREGGTADEKYWEIHNGASGELKIRAINDTYTSAQDALMIGRGSGATVSNFQIHTNGSERARIDSVGRFGIGTSSPNYTLDLNSGAATPAQISTIVNWNFPGFILRRNASNVSTAKMLSMILQGDTDSDTTLTNHLNIWGTYSAAPTTGSTTAGLSGVMNLGAPSGIALHVNGSERGRVDSSGRLLVGASSFRQVGTIFSPSTNIQVEGSGDGFYQVLTGVANRNDANGPVIGLGKSRGVANGSSALVQSGDSLGDIIFAGADGVDLSTIACSIGAYVDGAPGTDDMPGRLVFSTTADGASSPTERMRITQAGNVGIGASGPGTSLDVQKPSASATIGNIRVAPTSTGQARYHLFNGGAIAEWLFGQKTSTDHDFKLSKSVAGSEADYVAIKTSGIINIAVPPTYADNAAATSGGLVAGDIYRKSDGTLMIRY